MSDNVIHPGEVAKMSLFKNKVKLLVIFIMLFFVIFAGLNSFAFAGDRFDISSPQDLPGFASMPEPFKNMLIFLSPANVNNLTPFFYSSRNIKLLKINSSYKLASETAQAPENFINSIETVSTNVQMPPFNGMNVEYKTPERTDIWGIWIWYKSSVSERSYPVIITVSYMPVKQKYPNGEYYFKNWTDNIKNFKDAPAEKRYKINIAGVPVKVEKKELLVLARPAPYYTGKENDKYEYNYTYEFIAGRFSIRVSVDDLHWIHLEKDNDRDIGLTPKNIDESRDIEPLVAGIINYIKGLKEEIPVIEKFIDLKIDKSSIFADGKTKVKITGKLRDKNNKGFPGYKIKVEDISNKIKLNAPDITTDANGNFQYVFTAPGPDEVPDLLQNLETKINLQFTAINPETGKNADVNDIGFILKGSSGINIFIHDENGKPAGHEMMEILWWDGKITKTKKVFSDDAGKCFAPFPFGTDVLVKFNDPEFLTFAQKVKAPKNIDILRTNVKDYSKLLKTQIADFLKKGGFTDEEISNVINAKVNFAPKTSNRSEYDAENKTINIKGGYINTLGDLKAFQDDFVHEVGHLISDTISDRSGMFIKGIPVKGKWVGGAHDVWTPAQDQSEQLAFEEAEAHFFADLFYKSTGQVYNQDFAKPDKSAAVADKYIQNGNIIEGNVASFLKGYYLNNNPGSTVSAPLVFKDFVDTIKDYKNNINSFHPVRTVEEFLDAKFVNKNPGTIYSGNLSLLAKDYRIKAEEIWKGNVETTDDIKAINSVTVTRNGKPEDFSPDMAINDGDIIEVPENVKVTFQKFPKLFLTGGEKEWVVLGPGKNVIQVDKNYRYLQLNYGKAQFINTGAMVLDPTTGLPVEMIPGGTDFILEVNEKKNAKLTMLDGKVTIEKNKEKTIVNKDQMLEIIPGKPLDKPVAAVIKDAKWWITVPVSALRINNINNNTKQGVLITFRKGKVKLIIPDDWAFKEKENKQIAQLWAPEDKAMIAIWETKYDNDIKIEDFIVSYEKDKIGEGEDKYFTKKISQTPEKISGIDGFRCEYLKKNEKGNISFTGYLIFKNKTLYEIYCLTKEKDADVFKPVFDKIVKSLIIE